jgi:hypothetical protein
MNSVHNVLHQSQHTQQKPTISIKSLNPVTIFAAVLVIILAAGTGGYWLGTRASHMLGPTIFQPSPISVQPFIPVLSISPTSATVAVNWKTYTSSEQGFSFRYPSDWNIVKSDTFSVILQKEEQLEAQGSFPAQTINTTIRVSALDLSPNTTLDKWFETRYRRGEDDKLFRQIKQNSKKTILSGVSGIEVQIPGAAGYVDEGTIAIYQGKGYDISISGFKGRGSYEAYQTVLSTFKFR